MDKFLKWWTTLYLTNATFHSLVVAVEWALITFFSSYSGGMPRGKAAWTALAVAVGGAVWSGLRRWLVNDYAQQGLPLKAFQK